MSDATPKLNAALKAAQTTMKPVEKGSINPAFKDAANPTKAKGTPYADFEDIVEATRPHLVANGIAVSQEPCEAPEGFVKIRTVLLHESGEERSGILSLPCSAKTPQAYGSAISYAKRYSYQAMTGAVAKGEDDDGNASSGKAETTTRRAAPAKAEPPKMAPDPIGIEVEAVIAAAPRCATLAEYEALKPKAKALEGVASPSEYARVSAAMAKRKGELSKGAA